MVSEIVINIIYHLTYIVIMATKTIPNFLISPNYRPATNPTTINTYVGRGGQSATGSGEIPVVEYLKKLEQTCMFEDEDRLNDHFRSSLKDRTPSAPTLASDATRKDRHSSEILSIRHNMSRTAEEPYHPDLNLSFTERDPRGIALNPNMRKLALQSGFRTKYKDFVNDNLSDAQITGGNRSVQKQIKDRVTGFQPLKKRWKIFETSRDGRSVKSNMPGFSTNKRSDASKVILNRPNLRVNESSQATRDAVTKISNALPIGSRKTVSHRFKIADYSQIRSSKYTGDNDFRKIMDQVEEDQDAKQSKEDTTRSIAYTMSTAANKAIEFGAEREESFDTPHNRKAVRTGNVREGFEAAECSEINPANMIFQHYVQKPQSRTTICKDTLSRESEIDKSQFALIKEMGKNRSSTFSFDPRMAWEGESDQVAARDYKVHVYKTGNVPSKRTGADDVDYDHDVGESAFTQLRSTSHNKVGLGGARDVDPTADWKDSGFKDRHGAPLGEKSKAKYYGTGDNKRNNAVGEMDYMPRSSNRVRARGTTAALRGSVN